MRHRIFTQILFFILCTGSSGFLCAQDYLTLQLKKAETLYASEKYFDAVTEAKRLLCFDRNKKFGVQASLLIADSYKQGARLNDAVKYFTIAAGQIKNDSLWFQTQIEIVRCNILRKTSGQADIILDRLASDRRFASRQKEIAYWRGWNFIFSDEWEKAAVEFAKFDEFSALKKLSQDTENEKYSVSFAKVISYILPGFGQFYTGNYLSGVMSIAWTGLWGYLAWNAFSADRAFDGAVMTGLFVRFHRGNVQNAEKFAVEKNREITDKALNYLQYKYEGLKP